MTRASIFRRNKKAAQRAPAAGNQAPAGAVFVAIASYDGKIDAHLAKALLNEQNLLHVQRWIMGFDVLEHNAIIATARNLLVDHFLRDFYTWGPDGSERLPYTDLLFIDADVTFERGAIARIVQHDADVVFGCPPMKLDDECYPFEFERNAEGYGYHDERNGLIPATFGPAGFLRIRRGVFDRMIAAGKAPEVISRNHMGVELERHRAFFHVGHEGTRYIGEDVWFFERWREAGGRVWLDPELGFEHSGLKRWKGHIGHFIQAKQAEEQRVDAERRDREDTARRLAEAGHAAPPKEPAQPLPVAGAAD